MTLALVLAVLATYRATRLVTTDRILDAPREWIVARYERLGYLVGCDWCSSIWLAPWFVTPAVLWPGNRAVLVVLGVLAASGVTGFLAAKESEDIA